MLDTRGFLKILDEEGKPQLSINEDFILDQNPSDLEQMPLSILDIWGKSLPEGWIRELVFFTFGFQISDELWKSIQDSKNSELSYKLEKVRQVIDQNLVQIASSTLTKLLLFDLERRSWYSSLKEYRQKFIRQQISEIQITLEGDFDIIISKLIDLFFDKLIQFFQKGIEHPATLEAMKAQIQNLPYKDYPIKSPYQLIELLEQGRTVLESDSLLQLDADHFEPQRQEYKRIAQNYLNGIMRENGRFRFLYLGLVEAQIAYKRKLESFLELEQTHVNNPFYSDLCNALSDDDVERFIQAMISLFASVPYDLGKNAAEAHYHIFTHLTLMLTGYLSTSEVQTNAGRIDTVIETDRSIYILEYKLNSADEAMTQIIDRRYWEMYVPKKKEIYLLGIAFDRKKRNISDYRLGELKDMSGKIHMLK